LRPRIEGCGSKGSSAPHSSSVRSLGYRFVFFSMAAMRSRVDLFHIDSLNHACTRGSSLFQTASQADGTLDPISHKVAHAILGCAVGAASGGDCAAGAAGAAIGEVVAGALGQVLSGSGPLDNTARRNILAASEIAGILGAAAFGGDEKAAASAAVNAVLNNYLTTFQLADVERRLSECKGDQLCRQVVTDQAKLLSQRQDSDYAIAAGTCALGNCTELNRLDAELLSYANTDNLVAYIHAIRPDLTDQQVTERASIYMAEFQSSRDAAVTRFITGALDTIGQLTAALMPVGGVAGAPEQVVPKSALDLGYDANKLSHILTSPNI
jgi:Possible hemagglutinin (DUF637)./Possible hemagglutinin (DUF638).